MKNTKGMVYVCWIITCAGIVIHNSSVLLIVKKCLFLSRFSTWEDVSNQDQMSTEKQYSPNKSLISVRISCFRFRNASQMPCRPWRPLSATFSPFQVKVHINITALCQAHIKCCAFILRSNSQPCVILNQSFINPSCKIWSAIYCFSVNCSKLDRSSPWVTGVHDCSGTLLCSRVSWIFISLCWAFPQTYTILPKVLAPLLMKGLTTLVISMSTNLNV